MTTVPISFVSCEAYASAGWALTSDLQCLCSFCGMHMMLLPVHMRAGNVRQHMIVNASILLLCPACARKNRQLLPVVTSSDLSELI